MNCWLCGGPMTEVKQRTIPSYLGHWSCPGCEVESNLPGTRRKAFKSGSRYVAEIGSVLFWDGQGSGPDHYTEVVTRDHGMVRGAYL